MLRHDVGFSSYVETKKMMWLGEFVMHTTSFFFFSFPIQLTLCTWASLTHQAIVSNAIKKICFANLPVALSPTTTKKADQRYDNAAYKLEGKDPENGKKKECDGHYEGRTRDLGVSYKAYFVLAPRSNQLS